MNPSCLEFDISKIDAPDRATMDLLRGLPGLDSASAGMPLGELILPALDKDLGGVLSCAANQGGVRDSESAYQLVRRLFLRATAPCFFIVTGEETIDARKYLTQQWLPEEGIQRSNAGLRVARLVNVKSAFGFSNSDMARICRVSRPQLYKWLSDEQSVELTMTNWQRLAQLEQLAKEWNKLSGRPLRTYLDVKVDGQRDIVDLLSGSELDEGLIRDAMTRLASMSGAIPATRDARVRAAGIRRRPNQGNQFWDE